MERQLTGSTSGRLAPQPSAFTPYPPSAILLFTLAMCLLYNTASSQLLGQGSTDSGCDTRSDTCWNLYIQAENTLGVRDEHFGPEKTSNPTEDDVRRRCIALRTFNLCMRNMTRPCRGDLNFHSMEKVISKRMKESNCTAEGEVFHPVQVPDTPTPPYQAVCSYDGKQPQQLCLFYGDPHLRTFDGDFSLCRAAGAWPLISNDYLTVQVTSQPVTSSVLVTSVTEVTVIVKGHESCASEEFATYQAPDATGADLPATFHDGRAYYGQERSVQITEVLYNEHVDIYLRYINTTVSLRRHGRYFSLAISMPQDIIDETRARWPDSMQLCMRGCPEHERVDVSQVRPRKHTDSEGVTLSLEVAEALCKDVGVVDEFYDSCVLDLMLSGDVNTTRITLSAMQDTLRLLPRHKLMNRTSYSYPVTNSGAVRTGGAMMMTLTQATGVVLCGSSSIHYLYRTIYVLLSWAAVCVMSSRTAQCVGAL